MVRPSFIILKEKQYYKFDYNIPVCSQQNKTKKVGLTTNYDVNLSGNSSDSPITYKSAIFLITNQTNTNTKKTTRLIFLLFLSLPTFWINQSAQTGPLSCIQGWIIVHDSRFNDCTARPVNDKTLECSACKDQQVSVPFLVNSQCWFDKHLLGDLYAMMLKIKGATCGGPRTTTRSAI